MKIQFSSNLDRDTKEDLLEHYNEIVKFLIKYGNMQNDEAHQKIIQSKLFDDLDRENAALYILHEEPYYWAMTMIQDDPEWFRDPKLWPPPRE